MLPSEAEPLPGLRRSLASTENGRTGESCEPRWFAVTVQTPARLFPSESLLDVRFVSVAIAAIGSPLARCAMKLERESRSVGTLERKVRFDAAADPWTPISGSGASDRDVGAPQQIEPRR